MNNDLSGLARTPGIPSPRAFAALSPQAISHTVAPPKAPSPREPSRKKASHTALALAGFLLLSGAAMAQEPTGTNRSAPGPEDLPRIEEDLAVRLINVDVVVTDRQDQHIRGLTRDDFELRINGEKVDFTHFAEIDRRTIEGSRANKAEVEDADVPSAQPWLVILVDGQTLPPAPRRALIDAIDPELERLVERSRGVMVAGLARRLELDQPFTKDVSLVRQALERTAKRVVTQPRLDSGLVRIIDYAPSPTQQQSPGAQLQNRRSILEARRAIYRIRDQANAHRHDIINGTEQVRQLIATLGGVPGRSTVLFLSNGIATSPAEQLFHMWWNKFEEWAPQLDVRPPEVEIRQYDTGFDIPNLVEHAARNRVTFYALSDLRGRDRTQVTSGAISTALAQATDLPQETLALLANSTGGLARQRATHADDLVGVLDSDLNHHYSLAFDPDEAGMSRGNVKVKVKRRGVRLRYLERFKAEAPEDALEDLALASLVLDAAENPLGASIEIGEAKREDKGRYLLPILVKVPIANLTLMPLSDRHVAGVSLVVAARNERGGASKPVHGRIPIVIPNDSLLEAMSQSAGGRLDLMVSAGPQKIAIGLRDDVGQTQAGINLAIDVGSITEGEAAIDRDSRQRE